MSKYDEIAKLYHDSRVNFRRYEDECSAFSRELISGLLKYMEWPRDQEVTYLAVGEEIDPDNKFYALAGAFQMDNQSFWHFGVELRLQEASGAYPLSLVLSFFIKKVGPHFIVKLGSTGREVKIPESKRNELEPFYEVVFKQIKEFFHKHYIQAVTGNENHFGFISILR